VIVVDDGSTDGTSQLLAKEFGSRLYYLRKENGGLSSARNSGLKHARGKYVQFLDADDILLPSKIATHVRFLENHPEYGVVYCDCMCFRDNDSQHTFPWGRKELYRSGDVFESLLGPGYLLPHMPLVAREWMDRTDWFDERLRSGEDREFWLRLAWAGAKFYYLEGEPLVLYRQRPDSMSQRRVDHSWWNLQVMRKVRTYVVDSKLQSGLKLTQAEGYVRFGYGRALAEEGKLWQGLWEMVRAILQDRRDLDYKVAFVVMTIAGGPRSAGGKVETLRRFKLIFRGASAGSTTRRKSSP
jgi:glycosyltransferase involved in cell wall biosynthesis